MKVRNFNNRHKIISKIRDLNIIGSGSISRVLSKLLIPKPHGEIIIKTLHNFNLFINPQIDKGVERVIYNTGTYEKGILSLMDYFLKKGDIFVDIGANIGLMSIYASHLIGNKGKVYSFEPNPDTKNILDRNITLNNILNIETFEYALGSENEKGKIFLDWDIGRGGASLISSNTNIFGYEVQIVRLDEIISQSIPIKLIKIDIEGFELEAIKGFGSLLKRPSAPILIVESSNFRGNYNSTKEDLYHYIKNINSYSIFKLQNGKEKISKLIEVSDVNYLPEHDNIICILENYLPIYSEIIEY